MHHPKNKVLHLVGSPNSHYYYSLSIFYANGTMSLFEGQNNYEHKTLICTLGGNWYFQSSISPIENEAYKLDLPTALLQVMEWKPDIMIPYMYCFDGLIHCRSLFELLNIGYTGSSPDVMALTLDKWNTKAILNAAGVPVPMGEAISKGEMPTLPFPFVVKPRKEDNSLGISIVNNITKLQSALDLAFEYDEKILCEEYIGLGREIRIAVLENLSGELELLPCTEYLLEEGQQIRAANTNKFIITEDGAVTSHVLKKLVCPAIISSQLRDQLERYAFKAFKALGAKYCCVFDIRVNETDEPYFLEAGCYCTLTGVSAIPTMVKTKGMKRIELFEHLFALVKRDKKPLNHIDINTQKTL